MKKVKVAQIGISNTGHGIQVWGSLVKQADVFDVVGYVLPENERELCPKRVTCFEGYPELTLEQVLADPEIEAVVIETEERYLVKYALMAAKAGKHVHMEKPGGTELAEFEELISTLQKTGNVFSTGYMYRFNPKIKEAMARIERGELGKIYAVEAHMDCKHPAKLRSWLSGHRGGMMFYLGCHLVDLIYRLQGEPLHVIPLNCATGFEGVASEDYGMAVFQYPNGVSFAKTCAFERGGFQRRQLVICGELGTIEIKPLEVLDGDGVYTVSTEAFADSWREPLVTSRTETFDRYDGMMKNFAEMVRGKENPYSYEYELNLYKLLLRACGREI